MRNAAPIQQFVDECKPFVFAFWHGSMLFPWWWARKTKAAALVSQSKDGEILSGILEQWGYTVVRGSSSKGSKDAMQQMRDLVERGHTLCITPDGPRGPMHELRMGAVRVAQTKGVPLFFCTVAYRKKKVLRSWDRFEVPLPFTRAGISFSDPVFIPNELTGEPLEELRREIETAMRNAYAELREEVT